MKPSPHYAQHHDLEAPRVDATAFRPAWRVHTQLDRLLAQRAILHAEWDRAVAFRRDLEVVVSAAYPTAPALDMPITLHSPALLPVPGIRLDALGRIERICRALGERVCGLLRAVLVDDPTWTALGARLRIDPRTARVWTVAAIKALAGVERA